MLDILRERTAGRRVLVLGIGNPLCGDDGLGPALVERLKGQVRVALLNAEDTPENHLDEIESANPELVLVVDAADLGGGPGDVALLGLEQLDPAGGSSHAPGLGLLFKALKIQPDVLVLAVQPETNQPGDELSPSVLGTLNALQGLMLTLFENGT